MHDLPSLNGLRAFEAAARRGSVKAAAAELYVTPGAVSQQVKGLEEALGVTLFRRRPTGLELTAAGTSLYPVLHDAFRNIGESLQRLRTRERTGPLTVSVLPSFASKWLVPRLGSFRAQHPGIDVRISATNLLTDFSRDDVDLAIRLGRGDYPGLRCDFLFNEPLFPVCSPALAAGPPPLHRPAELRSHTLLHDEAYDAWEMWLRLHGVEGVEARRGPVFSDASMALQAAIEGQGVAMARGELVERDLAEGRLVRPFDLTIPYEFAYYVVSPPAVGEWPKVAAFREWLREEARRYQGERAPEQGTTPRPARVGARRQGRPRARRAQAVPQRRRSTSP